MSIKNMKHEEISAFADAELAESRVEEVLATLRTEEGRQVWSTYHRVGDALRSDDLAFELKGNFTERLMRQIEREPALVAPQAAVGRSDRNMESGRAAHLRSRAWWQGAAAAAAVAVLAVLAVPRMMPGARTDALPENMQAQAETATGHISMVSATMPASKEKEQVLRDPGIDEYLTAHERFSPSFYGTAQYARSATFASDTGK